MPGRDGTGPMGAGPATGRGLGQCTSANTGKYVAGIGFGLGLGLACRRGFGRWFGRGNRRYATNNASYSSSKELLKAQKDLLQDRIKDIDNQLEEL